MSCTIRAGEQSFKGMNEGVCSIFERMTFYCERATSGRSVSCRVKTIAHILNDSSHCCLSFALFLIEHTHFTAFTIIMGWKINYTS